MSPKAHSTWRATGAITRKEGLEVDLILMRGGVANQALIAGNVEFTTVPTAGLQAAIQGAPLKVILSTFHKPMFWLYSRPEIRSIKDLSGKKVAVSSLGAAGDSALARVDQEKRHGRKSRRRDPGDRHDRDAARRACKPA